MKKKTSYAAMAALFFILPCKAFADCEDIAENETWRRNLIDVAAYHDHGDFQESLDIGLKMLSICDRSPALNYYIASDYQALGDNTRAFEYILKASDGTAHMATSKENEDSIKRKRKELETIVMGENSAKISLIKYKDEYKTAMWAGAVVAVTGAILTVVGAVLAINNDETDLKKLCDNHNLECKEKDVTTEPDPPAPPDDQDQTSLNDLHSTPPEDIKINNNSKSQVAGYVLLGSGLVMLIGGAILGGIYGHKYNHFEEDNKQVSFYLTPTSVGLSIAF